MERVSEIPRSVGVSVCLVVAFARRASLGARDFLERRWFRDGGTHLHESPGALSFQTLGEDAALASPALRAVPRKVTRASRFLKLANASAERALAPSRVACEARDGGDWGAATTTGRCGLKSARFVSLCPLEGAPDAALRRIASSGEGEKTRAKVSVSLFFPKRNAASHASNHSSPRDWPWEKSVKASARMSKQSKSGKKIPLLCGTETVSTRSNNRDADEPERNVAIVVDRHATFSLYPRKVTHFRALGTFSSRRQAPCLRRAAR